MSMLRRIVLPLLFAASAALSGCATNPRFDTALSSNRITGEGMCEVPQLWKALALKGVRTSDLSQATIVQVAMTPEWIGDALGWPVPINDREVRYLPRLVWPVLLVTPSGEQRFYSAIAKNPLINPYFTVVIPDRSAAEVNGGDRIIILSGAHTKALTTKGDTVSLRADKNCISAIDEGFFKDFPSPASGAVDLSGDHVVVRDIRKTFLWPTRSDGVVYSVHSDALSPEVFGDVRQTTYGERFRGHGGGKLSYPIGAPLVAVGVGNLLNNVVPAVQAFDERYVGPFGERQYSAEEAGMILASSFRQYSAYVHNLERNLGREETPLAAPVISFEGSRSGWQIARDLYLDIEDMWSRVEVLRAASVRSKSVRPIGLLTGGPNLQGEKHENTR
jgi:hypothetical protein